MRPPPTNPRSTASLSHFSRFRTHKASGLIDVIVAITIIGLMGTAALSLLRVSSRSEQGLEARNTANDLALDAFAALENIRGTNYLRFASDPDNCWNKLEITDVADCATADAANTITDEGVTYYLAQDFDNSPLGEWHLYEDDPGTDEDTFIDLYTMNGNAWYLQSGVTNADFLLEESHVFERTLTATYGDLDGDGIDDYYDATVTVTWTDRSSTEPHVLTKTGRIAHIY